MKRFCLVISGVFILTLLLCSIFAETSQSAGCSGQLFFTNPTVPSQAPAAVVFADFNNDTKADMAVANFGFGTVSVSLGDGSGGFGTPQTFPSGFGAMSIAVGDFNIDGKLDMVVADWFNHQVAISFGLGDGTFLGPLRINVGLGPHQVVTGDFNGDSKLDFATAGFFVNGVSVFLGDGGGGFSQANGSPFAAGTGPRSLRLADFNSDNKLDAAVASGSGLTVLLGDGMGGLAASGGPITVGQAPFYVDSGDFNGDSKLDLAVANNSSSDVSVLFGDGAAHFQLVATVGVGAAPREILVTDLDGSGKPDIVSANFDSNTISVLLNNGSGTLNAAKSFPVGNNPRALASTDLNGDGNRDLAVANYNSYTVSILKGTGGGNFSGPAITPVFANPAHSLAVGDYNSDGRVDLAAGNNGRTSILLSNTSGGFDRIADVGFGPAAFVSSVDLDGDGKLDLVVSDGAGGNTVSSMLGLGDGNFGPRKFISVGTSGTSPTSIAVGDFNGDGKPDAATSNYGSANLSILLGDGLGGFVPPTAISLTAQTPFVASGDFNNDGKPDLVASRYFFDNVAVLLGIGNGTFQVAAGSPFNAGSSPQAIAVSDFNGDGDSDLAITNQLPFNPTVSILLGNGTGSFSSPVSYIVGARPSSIAVGDYNLDGKPDLATANQNSNDLSVLLGNGDGTFGSATNLTVGQSPVFVVAGDFNNDGRKDLAAAMALGVVSLPNLCSSPPVVPSSLSIADITIPEGDSGTANAVLTIALSAPSDVTVAVSFNVFGMTASPNVDFQPVTGRLKFAPGVTTQTINVTVAGDDLDEFDEIIGIKLTDELNATISRAVAKATIVDDDPPPAVSINDVSIQEGDAGTKTANLTVALSKVSGKPISLQYATGDGTAVAGADYISKSGTISISPGTLSSNISVQIVGETVFEADESFFVTLSNPLNAVINKGQGQVSILNDDTLQLMLDVSGPAANQVAALESLLFVRDPFHVLSIAEWVNLGSDRNTRVVILAANLALNQGESSSAVIVTLTDGSNQSYDVPAEDVRAVPNSEFAQIVFRLPNNLSAGVCKVTIKAHGQISNTGTIRIVQ